MTPEDARLYPFSPSEELALLTVESEAQARLLSDPGNLAFLEPFLAREASVSQAARELDRPLDTVRYRVRRFLEAGLVEVTREERRPGRPIRYYRTVADGFVVPFELTPYAEIEDRLRDSLRATEETFVRAAARSLRRRGLDARRIYRNRDGRIRNETANPVPRSLEEREPIEAMSVQVRLSAERARELLQRLYGIAQELEESSQHEDGDAYLFAFQLAPVLRE